ncbi:MAG TPA: hypothetical protein VI643_00445, partial [Planctomycetota bacterium]|nr:hypothetical protein [Planctomycetota bacterium]
MRAFRVSSLNGAWIPASSFREWLNRVSFLSSTVFPFREWSATTPSRVPSFPTVVTLRIPEISISSRIENVEAIRPSRFRSTWIADTKLNLNSSPSLTV